MLTADQLDGFTDENDNDECCGFCVPTCAMAPADKDCDGAPMPPARMLWPPKPELNHDCDRICDACGGKDAAFWSMLRRMYLCVICLHGRFPGDVTPWQRGEPRRRHDCDGIDDNDNPNGGA